MNWEAAVAAMRSHPGFVRYADPRMVGIESGDHELIACRQFSDRPGWTWTLRSRTRVGRVLQDERENRHSTDTPVVIDTGNPDSFVSRALSRV